MTWLVVDRRPDGGWSLPRLVEDEAAAEEAARQAREWRGHRTLAVDLDELETTLLARQEQT